MLRFKQYLKENKKDYNLRDPEEALWYALSLHKRVPDLEPVIFKDPQSAYHYVHSVVGHRLPEAEEIIIKSPIYANYYAQEIIGGRWPEAEKSIIRIPKRWKEYVYKISRGNIDIDQAYSIKELIENIPEKVVYIDLTSEEEQYYVQIHGKKALLLNKMLTRK